MSLITGASRLDMLTMNGVGMDPRVTRERRWWTWLVAGLVLLVQLKAASWQPQVEPGLRTVTVEVELSCPSCAQGLERRLGRLPHVAQVMIRSEAGEVVVIPEPATMVNLSEIRGAIRNAGFLPTALRVTAVGKLADHAGQLTLLLPNETTLMLVAADGVTLRATDTRMTEVTGVLTDATTDGSHVLRVETLTAQ